MRLELVKDWMTRDVHTISPQMGVLEADNRMRELGVRRFPVVENGRLVGIVTHGDIREAKPSTSSALSAWEMNYLMARLPVAEIMTPNPATIGPEAIIGEAANIMYIQKISGLPVVDSAGALVGIITESDIFRMVVHEWSSAEGESPQPYQHYDG